MSTTIPSSAQQWRLGDVAGIENLQLLDFEVPMPVSIARASSISTQAELRF
mgnify:CR=1